MKAYFFILFLLASLFVGQETQAQASQSTNQFFVLDGSFSMLQLDLQSDNVKIHRTPGTRIRIEMLITVGTPNVKMLEYLMEKGRYQMTETVDASNATFQITHPTPSSKIILKGEECHEEFKYVIYVPESVEFVMLNGVKTAVAGVTTLASSK